MKAAIFATLMMVGAFAQAHNYTRGELGIASNLNSKSCAQAQDFVATHGYFIRYTYDGPIKVVVKTDEFQCPGRQLAPVWEPTTDNDMCVVGYLCRSGN
ncbi:MAG: hypothetical protein KF802_15160 [Bdellovibrionaceae bacterium]|nr:hypothetical protein [Pseudobdellovibrionaceae bacterium]MBX3033425.1 hypothetical protein [Pseudobdellovibrionaceae bacterium]